MAQALVLDDGGVTDPLILAEDAVGKQKPFGSRLKSDVWEVIDIKILTTEIFGRGCADTTSSVRPVDLKDWVLIRIEGHWAPKIDDIVMYRAKITVRALAHDKAKSHQSTGCVDDEYQ